MQLKLWDSFSSEHPVWDNFANYYMCPAIIKMWQMSYFMNQSALGRFFEN